MRLRTPCFAIAAMTLSIMLGPNMKAESLLPSAQPVEVIANRIAQEKLDRHTADADTAANAAWKRRWAFSIAPLVASQALDSASSYGMRELNPLLASPNGGFGMKATSVKFSTVAGLMGAEYLLVKKFPRSAKFFTVVNWTAAGATTGLAVHNYRLPGR